MEIVGVLIGGVLAIAGGIIANYIALTSQQKMNRKSLAGGFAGEIEAIIEIVKKRQYVEHLEQLIAKMQKPDFELMIMFYFHVTYDYFSVYKSNVDKLGSLSSPLPKLIATFYTQCFAILEDIKQIENLNIDEISREQLIGHYTELLALFKDTSAIGEEALGIINKS